ncbi:hypothetical protein HDU96_004277 [Phlyctochytrium bullatum]|nr:hypothetical protein HDU96_004277 [Phlyctochytrium bullatum]
MPSPPTAASRPRLLWTPASTATLLRRLRPVLQALPASTPPSSRRLPWANIAAAVNAAHGSAVTAEQARGKVGKLDKAWRRGTRCGAGDEVWGLVREVIGRTTGRGEGGGRDAGNGGGGTGDRFGESDGSRSSSEGDSDSSSSDGSSSSGSGSDGSDDELSGSAYGSAKEEAHAAPTRTESTANAPKPRQGIHNGHAVQPQRKQGSEWRPASSSSTIAFAKAPHQGPLSAGVKSSPPNTSDSSDNVSGDQPPRKKLKIGGPRVTVNADHSNRVDESDHVSLGLPPRKKPTHPHATHRVTQQERGLAGLASKAPTDADVNKKLGGPRATANAGHAEPGSAGVVSMTSVSTYDKATNGELPRKKPTVGTPRATANADLPERRSAGAVPEALTVSADSGDGGTRARGQTLRSKLKVGGPRATASATQPKRGSEGVPSETTSAATDTSDDAADEQPRRKPVIGEPNKAMIASPPQRALHEASLAPAAEPGLPDVVARLARLVDGQTRLMASATQLAVELGEVRMEIRAMAEAQARALWEMQNKE